MQQLQMKMQEQLAQPEHKGHSGVTELVLTKQSPDQRMLLLPMIAHLSQQADRWITWIAPGPIERQQLESYGIDTLKLRIINSQSEETNTWMLWDALNNGTSHTVIGTVSKLNDQAITQLEEAAQNGNAKALLVRYR